MDTRTQYTLASLVRVDTLLDEHAADLPDVAKSVARQELRELVERMREHGVVQRDRTIQARGQTQSQRVSKDRLRRRYMAPIVRIARLRLRDEPGFADLKLPDTRLEGTSLVDAARAMVTAASRYSEVFIANGLPSDFVEKMTELVNTLQQTMIERDTHRLAVRSRTVAAQSDRAQARRTLTMLNTLVRADVESPALLAKWDAARRVNRKPGVPVGSVSTSGDDVAEEVTNSAPTMVPELETPVPVIRAAA
jgi:transposase-like protein